MKIFTSEKITNKIYNFLSYLISYIYIYNMFNSSKFGTYTIYGDFIPNKANNIIEHLDPTPPQILPPMPTGIETPTPTGFFSEDDEMYHETPMHGEMHHETPMHGEMPDYSIPKECDDSEFRSDNPSLCIPECKNPDFISLNPMLCNPMCRDTTFASDNPSLCQPPMPPMAFIPTETPMETPMPPMEFTPTEASSETPIDMSNTIDVQPNLTTDCSLDDCMESIKNLDFHELENLRQNHPDLLDFLKRFVAN